MEIYCIYTFAGVLSDVDAKLNDVAGENLAGRTLLWATTQPLAVDERPVAAFSVLQVELKHTEKHSGSETREDNGQLYLLRWSRIKFKS